MNKSRQRQGQGGSNIKGRLKISQNPFSILNVRRVKFHFKVTCISFVYLFTSTAFFNNVYKVAVWIIAKWKYAEGLESYKPKRGKLIWKKANQNRPKPRTNKELVLGKHTNPLAHTHPHTPVISYLFCYLFIFLFAHLFT